MLQAYYLPLIRRQPFERATNLPDSVQRIGGLGLRRQRRISWSDRLERVGAPARLAALDVDRGTSCDRRQPRRHLAVLIETAGRAPGIQEGLLGRLFSQSGVSQHAIGDSVDETPVCAIDAADGIGIAVAEPPP